MALTDKQKRFADEYLIDMNATAAYLRAGYRCTEAAARSSACDLLTNPNISAYIESKQKLLEDKVGMTQEWVLLQYKTIIEDNIRVDPAVAKSALDSVAKHKGMFTDKVKMDVNGSMNNTTQDLSGLSPEERRARIDELNRRRGIGAHSTA